ncbi:MAG TPA: DUF6263 family protein [Chitinophagaceae bacterium]|jgi:hypothetical protein
MIKRTFLLLGVGVMTTVAVSAQKIAVTKGQKVEAVNSSKIVMSVEMAGQSMDFNTETAATSQVELKDVTPAGYLFGNTTTRIVTHATGMGQDNSFDSDKKEDMDGQMGQAMKGSIGKEQTIQVDKQGKITDVSADSAADVAGGGLTQIMNMTGGMMKGQPYPMLVQLPGHNIKTGDSWIDSTGSLATVKMVTIYTLKDINKDSVVVSFTATMAKKGTIEQGGMQIDMDMAGTIKGESAYETSTGLLVRSTTFSDVKGNVGVMGQSAPMTMAITSSTTAKKL